MVDGLGLSLFEVHLVDLFVVDGGWEGFGARIRELLAEGRYYRPLGGLNTCQWEETEALPTTADTASEGHSRCRRSKSP